MNTNQDKNKKLNVLLVSDYPLGEVMGGSVRVLYEQSTCLAARGHKVHILTREEQVNEGYAKIEDVQEWKYVVNKYNPFLFLKSTILNSRKLFESISEKYPFDVLIFHQPSSAFGVLRSPKSNNIKKIYTCHSLSFEEFQSRNPNPHDLIGKIAYQLNIFTRKYLERNVLKKSDIIVVLSQFTEEKLRRVYRISPEKIRVIPGGINLQRFYPANDRITLRRHLNIPQGKMILFTVRNLVPRMGLENLIYAVKEVVKTVPDIYLVLGGKGPQENDLISLTQELGMENHVKFAGFIPEAELPDYYRMADIFVLPTMDLEGFGLVTLEALACGVPVLGTPVGGTVEILSRLDSKYLFRDTQPKSMAELIIKTCQEFKDNPELWQDVSYQCRSFVEKHYSWEQNAKSLENLFTEVATEFGFGDGHN